MWHSVSKIIGALTSREDSARKYDIAAERIQSALLNVTVPRVSGLDVGVHAEPARLVGGDYNRCFLATGPLTIRIGRRLGQITGSLMKNAMSLAMVWLADRPVKCP